MRKNQIIIVINFVDSQANRLLFRVEDFCNFHIKLLHADFSIHDHDNGVSFFNGNFGLLLDFFDKISFGVYFNTPSIDNFEWIAKKFGPAYKRSRVMPSCSSTMEILFLQRALKRADLPTFGLPTMATFFKRDIEIFYEKLSFKRLEKNYTRNKIRNK